jgi:hypothetical protein
VGLQPALSDKLPACREITSDPAACLRYIKLLRHQILDELQAVAERVSKRGDPNYPRYLLNLTFKIHAVLLEVTPGSFEILDPQHYSCAAFGVSVSKFVQPDRRSAISVRELGPAIHLKRLFQAQHVSVKLLRLIQIAYLIPRKIDFHP